MHRRHLRWAAWVGVAYLSVLLAPATAHAAVANSLILNEANTITGDKYLDATKNPTRVDAALGRVQGNGQNWMEFMVVQGDELGGGAFANTLDIRGWKIDWSFDKPPETVVTVRGGSVVGVRHRPVGYDREVPAEARNLQYYWTVDGLFDLLAAAFDRGALVRATYDASRGFPTEIHIDYDKNSIGDELDIELTQVVPVTSG